MKVADIGIEPVIFSAFVKIEVLFFLLCFHISNTIAIALCCGNDKVKYTKLNIKLYRVWKQVKSKKKEGGIEDSNPGCLIHPAHLPYIG